MGPRSFLAGVTLLCTPLAGAANAGETPGSSSQPAPEPGPPSAEGAEARLELGEGLGFEVSTGGRGAMSFVELGVLMPQLFGHMTSGLKLTAMSATSWVTFNNLETREAITLHPVILGGVLSLGGTSEVVRDFVRVHGGVELLIGTTLTPYESYFYQRDNLIGDNLTYGIFGVFGLELFTRDNLAFFIDGGGGFRSYRVEDKDDIAAVAAGWIGSGYLIKVGTRFYL